MSARTEILESIRRAIVAPAELPALREAWIHYADPLQQYAEVLKSVGGRCVPAASLADVNRELASLPAFATGRRICSLVDGIDGANVFLPQVADPHELEDVDFAILPGQLAVAENGAVWVNDPRLTHRVVAFITQHLALVVPRADLLHNMHEAYARLTFGPPDFGVFISGPSKTADIEQSLVIGAHGARSLTVFLVG